MYVHNDVSSKHLTWYRWSVQFQEQVSMGSIFPTVSSTEPLLDQEMSAGSADE